MQTEHHIWRKWIENIHRWGIENIFIFLLEGFAPLNTLTAQLLLVSQPVLSSFFPAENLEALIGLFEDEAGPRTFIEMMHQPELPGS